MTRATAERRPSKTRLRFRARVENGVIIPEKAIVLPSGQTYLVTLQPESEAQADTGLDALAEIAAMAEPLGPADLARNFDTYTGRVILDEPAS
jgi:hypothetical protein